VKEDSHKPEEEEVRAPLLPLPFLPPFPFMPPPFPYYSNTFVLLDPQAIHASMVNAQELSAVATNN